MSKKDYILIAKAISEARTIFTNPGADTIASYIASALAQDNPRFDRERFIQACAKRGQ